MKVICISGHARSGKDTVGKIIKDLLKEGGGRVEIMHYADLLKYICKQFFGWNGEKDEKGRTLLQEVGTDVIRAQDENFWVDFLIHIMKFFSYKWDYVLIPDCRFPNEIDRLRQNGFDVVHLRIERDINTSLTAEQRQHPSETALDNTTPDYTILNNGSLLELANKIDGWIKEIL